LPEKKIAVVTDSACDLPDSLLEKYGIRYVALRLVCKKGEIRDRVEISADEVYALLRTEIPKTSLPFPSDVTEMYDALAGEGYTDVIHVSISSGLSGTYNMVRMIAEEYDRLAVHVFDSKTLSIQQGYIALQCARMLETTQDIDKILAAAQKMRESSAGMYVIRTLEYLRKGGRIGLVEGVLGTMLQLKPIIFVNNDGVYETVQKARGHANAIESMVREMVGRFSKMRVRLAVVHGALPAEGEKLLTRLLSLLNVEESMLVPVSPVLGAHTGPGLLGIIALQA